MIWAITMPTWGLSMEEGTIIGWQVAEGSSTAPGVELAPTSLCIRGSPVARESGASN